MPTSLNKNRLCCKRHTLGAASQPIIQGLECAQSDLTSPSSAPTSQPNLKPRLKNSSASGQTPEHPSTAQVVSKKRVADHGEVYTHAREVNAMLDLVKTETERVDSTFLEPACGTGNFLVEILNRKLAVVAKQYKKSQLEYERTAVLAVSSLYGIDILADNVAACKERLFEVFNAQYSALYKSKCKEPCRNTVRYILSRNILHGDALTLKTIADTHHPAVPIVFSEWKFPFNDSRIKRRDYVYSHLVDQASHRDIPLLSSVLSDLEEEFFIPEPVKDYPLTHFLRVGDAS